MAERHSTPTPDKYGFPRPPILKPEEYEGGEGCWSRWYALTTPSGALRVEETCIGKRMITGTVEALTAYGLIRPEWAPGLPGNGSTRQTVLFEDGEYRYPDGKLQCTPVNAIAILRGGKKLNVWQPYTTEEKAIIAPYFEQLRQDRENADRAKQEAERQSSPSKEAQPEDEYTWLQWGIVRAEVRLEEIKEYMGKGPFRYTDASHARILRCIAELKTAVREGVAMPRVAERQRVGNVVYLPSLA